MVSKAICDILETKYYKYLIWESKSKLLNFVALGLRYWLFFFLEWNVGAKIKIAKNVRKTFL